MDCFVKQNNGNEENEIDETVDTIINSRSKIKKEMINFKYLNDISYLLFNAIFNNKEFINENEKIIKINNFQKFYEFQKELNSKYNSRIKDFNYKEKMQYDIIKEIPYKPAKLRKISEENSAIKISPNGHFVSTGIIEQKDSAPSLAKYNTVIGNSIIIKGVYYYEFKILKLGEDSDIHFGIISKDSIIFERKECTNFPINAFNDGYSFNFNESIELNSGLKEKKIIKEGDIILVKINLNKKCINYYINGSYFKRSKILINDKNNGFYPALSLSSNKEILVNFGGVYDIKYIIENAQEFDKKPICQMNNLEKIVSCYINIIESTILKIINHPQITFNDSLRLFKPMLHFLANIAFNDEYIMKNYILNLMYERYDDNVEIYQYFNSRYNLIYLIFHNIEENKKLKSVLFLLDCLCEEIKYNSFDDIDNNCSFKKWNILVKLYNFFLKSQLFREILFKDENNNSIKERIKEQLFIIFQPIKVFGIEYNFKTNSIYLNKIFKIEVNKTIKEKMNKIIIKNILISFKELINTLLSPILECPEININQFDNINKNIKNNENISCSNESIYFENYQNSKEINNDLVKQIFLKIQSNKKNENENENIDQAHGNKDLKRSIKKNYYSEIFFNLIKSINNSNIDKYIFIPTIFFPLLFLFNETYEKEYSSTIFNDKNLLQFPFLSDDLFKMNNNNSELIIEENALDKMEILTKLISPKTFLCELNKEKYNSSSILLKIQMFIFSFLNDNLKIYDYLDEIPLKIEINKKNLYQYCWDFRDLLLIINKDYLLTMIKTIKIFVPYFNEIIRNNLYLLFPFTIINEIKFIIKYFFIHSFIQKFEWFKEKYIQELIDIFIKLNLKLLEEENSNKKHLNSVFTNFEFLINLFNKTQKFEFDDDEDFAQKENNYKEKSLDYYFKPNHIKIIFKFIKIYYNKNNKSIPKSLESLILNSASDSSSEFNNYFLENIIKNLVGKKNEFFFNIFIIDKFIKRKIIKKILKLYNIIEIFDKVKIKSVQFEKYCKSISCSLDFISECLKNKDIVKKFFDTNINIIDFYYKELEDSEIFVNIKDSDKNSPLYFCLIYIISLIINKLLTEKFFILLKNKDELKYSINSYSSSITNTTISFCKNVIIEFSKVYQETLKEKKNVKNLKKSNKPKKEEKEEKEEDKIENDELKNYYIDIFNKINKNNISKLIFTIEKYNNEIPIDFDMSLDSLKKILLYLNDIQNIVNTRTIDPEEEKELEKICPICLDKNSDSHVLPCSHAFCWECITKLTNDKCPICRKTMTGVSEHPDFRLENKMNNNHLNPFLMNNNQNNDNSIEIGNNGNNPFMYSRPSRHSIQRNSSRLSPPTSIYNNNRINPFSVGFYIDNSYYENDDEEDED